MLLFRVGVRLRERAVEVALLPFDSEILLEYGRKSGHRRGREAISTRSTALASGCQGRSDPSSFPDDHSNLMF